MGKILYDWKQPDLVLLRHAVFDRLRKDRDWKMVENEMRYFDPYIELKSPDHQGLLFFQIEEVVWRLLVEGVLSPGFNSANPKLPWFHLTDFGNMVINSPEPNPYDSLGYIKHIRSQISNPDNTVLAYLSESLSTYHHGNTVASTMMLGIAAERVFLLLCSSMSAAISSTKEKSDFEKILIRFPIKPKFDWMRLKIESLQTAKLTGFPDNAGIMITAIYDLLRGQRNDLGHPRDTPPVLSREDAFVNLQIFPRYYQTAETIRLFLAANKI
ncbi:MAG: hypothetical protein ABSF79_06535 [Smithellaceae bacterium]|jgi:hypothetical protein